MKMQAYRSIKNAIVYADKEGGKEIQGDEIMKVPIQIWLATYSNICKASALKYLLGIERFAW